MIIVILDPELPYRGWLVILETSMGKKTCDLML